MVLRLYGREEVLAKRYQAEEKETRQWVEAGGVMILGGLGSFSTTKYKKNHQAEQIGKEGTQRPCKVQGRGREDLPCIPNPDGVTLMALGPSH